MSKELSKVAEIAANKEYNKVIIGATISDMCDDYGIDNWVNTRDGGMTTKGHDTVNSELIRAIAIEKAKDLLRTEDEQ